MRSPALVTGRVCLKNGVASLEMGDRAMKRPEVPFPKHWLYYIAIKFIVLAGAVALVLRLNDVW
jgi:hypothetical protein